MSKITEAFGYGGGWHFERKEPKRERIAWKKLETRLRSARWWKRTRAEPAKLARYYAQQNARYRARRRASLEQWRTPENVHTCARAGCGVQWCLAPNAYGGQNRQHCSKRCADTAVVPSKNAERDAEIARRWMAGEPSHVIQAALGVTKATVRGVVIRRGLPKRAKSGKGRPKRQPPRRQQGQAAKPEESTP